ncbi:MAG: VirB4 family type IV secretion system protein [Sciscionella sp.]
MPFLTHRPSASPDPGSTTATAEPGFWPDSIDVAARHVQVGADWVASFAVVGYPREVHPGWLTPLLSYPGRWDVSLHIEPIDPVTATDQLKKQLARLESGRAHTAEHGRLPDPHVEAATEDAHELAARVARGEGRLFRLGLYLTVHADTEGELQAEVGALRALSASLLLDAKPATYRSLQGWVTASLPMGLDLLGMTRTLDTAALAAAFPFTSPDLPGPASGTGVLYGISLGGPSLVHWDRFALPNHNAVILGRSGAGKSYLVKLELLRSLYRGVQAVVIDPEDEYARLAHAVGGTHLPLGVDGVRLNPLDLPVHTHPDGRATAPADTLTRRALFLHTFLAVLFGQPLSPDERAVADQAITTTYARAGITTDPHSWTRPAPLLGDLRDALNTTGGESAHRLATRLHPFVDGAFASLLNGPSTRPDGHLIVICLRRLPDELKPVATLLSLDTIWHRVSHPGTRRPRLVVVDEAWLLMQQPSGAQFLLRAAKSFRKHWAGLTVATQDVADLLGSDLGTAVITNAATQILLRQAPQTIDALAHGFALSEGERQFLLAADVGHGLLCAGPQRVAFAALASPWEDELARSDPEFLADLPHTGTDVDLT